MKHGVAFRKFSRTSSHRMLMLRNLVTSLIEHEQIKTTLPKAKDTARLAEKLITMGKKGGLPMYQRANAFLLKSQLTPKVFGALAQRYSERPGGYTRIHKYGNRPGDNAPHAILELVDNPRDIKFDMTARAVGWDLASKQLSTSGAKTLVNEGVSNVEDVVEREQHLQPEAKGALRPKTRWNLQKVLRYRSGNATSELTSKAQEHIDTLSASQLAVKDSQAGSDPVEAQKKTNVLRLKAGERLPGGARSSLSLAQGALGRTPIGRLRWFERRKLGVDKSPLWEEL